MKSKTITEIALTQIKQIFKDDYSLSKKNEKNVFCGSCGGDHVTTIVDYRAYIFKNFDLLLRGKCKKCGHDVGRVLETGEVEKYKSEIESILEKSFHSH